MLMFFASCEEYYTPNIDTVGGQLVVEALITNDPSRNYVHLTTTNGFYDKQTAGVVLNSVVQLFEKSGFFINGTEISPGYFNFKTAPQIGKDYYLRVLYNNDTYTSEVVTMPPLPTILNAYSGDKVKTSYSAAAYGNPMPLSVKGRDIYIDAPVTDALAYYRFSTRSTIEWIYAPPGKGGPPPPPLYGWVSHSEIENFNIAGPKTFSLSDTIKKHQLSWLAYDAKYYLSSDTLVPSGWIIIVDQFGTSKGSYEFHEKMNSQFAADGSLFDPIQTQIYGNITCKTDSSKIAFGYFDLNSYRQYRYFMKPYSQIDNILRQIFRYPYIPYSGQTYKFPSDWWEN